MNASPGTFAYSPTPNASHRSAAPTSPRPVPNDDSAPEVRKPNTQGTRADSCSGDSVDKRDDSRSLAMFLEVRSRNNC